MKLNILNIYHFLMTKFLCLKSVDDCILLQTDIENIQVWCNANFVKLNSSKTMVIAFNGKINIHHYLDTLWDPSISRTGNIKYLGVQLE
jgi:hypothetical protein